MSRPLVAAACLLFAAACSSPDDVALGTLERDRISLPAPVSERIATMSAHEGQAVAAGELLLTLESTRTAAQFEAALADERRAQAALDEARHGALPAEVAMARARVRGAEGVARNAREQYARTASVVGQRLLPTAQLDQSRATRDAADAEVAAAHESLRLLEQGTRSERIAQAQAAAEAARALVQRQSVDLERTRVVAPRAGIVETLPFEVGDQPPPGASVATLLVGERAWARVYVPQSLRLHVAIGTASRVTPQGSDRSYAGRVRSVRSEPAFTPYYALAGRDVSRLSWLAEIELDADADALPVGVPVRAEFAPPSP